MAVLDFSVDKPDDASGTQAMSRDLQALVDQASLGTRSREGHYEVKDWEFSSKGVNATDDVIARALKPATAESSPSSGSLGALSSIFSRLTGSKVLTDDDLKPVIEAMKQHLMKKNVAMEIADKVCEGVGEGLVGKKVGGFQSEWFTLPPLSLSPDDACRNRDITQPRIPLSAQRCLRRSHVS